MKVKSIKFKTAIASIFASIFNSTLIPILASQFLLVACSASDVSVERKKPDIQTVFFDPENFEGTANHPELEPNEQALTEWEFGCQTNFDFDIMEESRMSTGKYFVRLKIKNVKMILSAPIKIWLPKNAAPDVVAHEKGHQDICVRAYAESDEVARRAARSVVEKSFEAEGDSREEACKKALFQAQGAVCAIYHQDVSDYASCISEIYDSIDSTEKGDSKDFVERAFRNYKRVSNTKQ
ncbi:MAG: hypothetical protein SFY67_09100 [Candidatus Melainabacteria bacterium]|nr:hypothetical protein [Candidatus Melainabacteria bacterium]